MFVIKCFPQIASFVSSGWPPLDSCLSDYGEIFLFPPGIPEEEEEGAAEAACELAALFNGETGLEEVQDPLLNHVRDDTRELCKGTSRTISVAST